MSECHAGSNILIEIFLFALICIVLWGIDFLSKQLVTVITLLESMK